VFTLIKSKWHRTRHWLNSRWQLNKKSLIAILIGSGAWIYIVLTSVFKDSGEHWDILFAVFLMAAARVISAFHPRETTEESKFREKRKIMTSTILDSINDMFCETSNISPQKLYSIRKELLDCIAQNVRQYRKDYHGIQIYSNLLIKDGDEHLLVIVRNSPRKEEKRYHINSLRSANVFDTLAPEVCGDAKASTTRHIPYASFLALPILNHTLDECIAVVTIDSTEPYHFDGAHEGLETTLRPYIRTLAITFSLETKRGSNNAE